jgi:nucleotide-binding universal stress UspA family protein
MFQKIVAGYDGSKAAKRALEGAAVMAKEYEAEITALWVREPLPHHSDLPREFEHEKEAADDYFKERSQEIKAVAERHGIDIGCVSRSGHPAKMLVRFADEGHYDLIVLSHRSHSELWGRLLGDTADRVTDHAHCSVLIAREQQYERILVGYDGSAGAKRALVTAALLAKKFSSKLAVVWVREVLPSYYIDPRGESEAGSEFFENLAREIKDFSKTHQIEIACGHLRGNPAHELVQRAIDERFDLVVIGNSGESGLSGRFLGTTADRVSEHAPCNVLVVR